MSINCWCGTVWEALTGQKVTQHRVLPNLIRLLCASEEVLQLCQFGQYGVGEDMNGIKCNLWLVWTIYRAHKDTEVMNGK